MGSRIKSVAVLSEVPNIFACVTKLLPAINVQEINPGSNDALSQLQKAEVILADFDKISNYINQLKGTKWIQGTWAGVELLLRQYAKNQIRPSCPIARFSGNHFGTIMSEYVVAHVTSFERDFPATWVAQKEKKWNLGGKIRDYRAIRDMEVGILGGGQIGLHMAGVLKMLGARIWCLVRTIPDTKSSSVDEYRLTNQLDEILTNCDLLVNVLPKTPATRGLLNSDNLSKCRNTLFVNVGRGSIVSEADLVEALEKRYLRGAILDVFNAEPLPSDSQLWELPQVVITPHVAGLTRAQDVASHFKQNLDLWNNEGRLMNVIDFERGY